MPYTIGQKVCLWQEKFISEGTAVTVLKEVIVTITEIKTGVLGEFSRKPVSSQSLRGIGDDGKVYEKHWDTWPESQTDCFSGDWSLRDDGNGVGVDKFWTPKEAVYAYNSLRRHNKNHGDTHGVILRTDVAGNSILPKGDFTHCKEHDHYRIPGHRCFECRVQERTAA